MFIKEKENPKEFHPSYNFGGSPQVIEKQILCGRKNNLRSECTIVMIVIRVYTLSERRLT